MSSVLRSTTFGSVAHALALSCVALLTVAACGDDNGGSGPGAAVATVAVTPATPAITVGGAVQLSASTRDSDGDVLTGRSITWTSLNSGVATVTQAGLVTGVGQGTVVIRATSEGRSGEATVTVTGVPVSSVTIGPDSARTSATVAVGDSLPLQITLRDAQGNVLTGRTVTYQSSNPAVVSVSDNGLVKAVTAGGPVTITATSEGRTATATINAIKPFLLTQVGGQNLPAPIPGNPSLVVVGGRIILYPNGRYAGRINYQTGPVVDEGTYTQSGTQIVLTSTTGTSVNATLVGNVLTRSVFTFVQ
ncbi:MAG: Ig-like domain-containing protein [Anaerolineae bacterium]|nr:Ig-like domain-containing protein [Gemmatimonadaceae bacterium]